MTPSTLPCVLAYHCNPPPLLEPVLCPSCRTFWSVAFNKMLVFSFAEFRKVVWMDSDSFALKNLDHLMHLPAFSATALPACCHGIGPA